MINTLYLPELREMLADRDTEGLREFCTALHPARAAEFMEGLTAEEAWQVLRYADPDTRISIFGYVDEPKQIEIIEKGDPDHVSQLIADMPADDRVDLLNEVDDAIVEQVLPLVPAEERRDILRLQSYPEGTAGARMTTELARLKESITVGEALKEIARQAQDAETIYYIYIVDDENHLRGLISARQLLGHLRKPEQPIADFMERDLVTAEATDDQEAVAHKMADYDFLAIPVVDHEQHLLGIITHDDILDVLHEEVTEDALLAGAVGPMEQSYLQTHWFTLARHRAGWLAILFVGSLFTALALQHNHETIEEIIWIVLFLPLIISSGGNSGSQSAALILRALSAKEITPSAWLTVVWRELCGGLTLGLFLGVIGFVVGLIFAPSPIDALLLPITLLLVILCGTLVGALLPLLFQRLGLDPALMSTPFVAGIMDIVGIVIYLNIALLLLIRR